MNVSNVKTHTLVEGKHVIRQETITPTSRKKNSFAENVLLLQLVVVKRLVKLTEQILSSTSVNSAVTYHSGSVGEIHISVSLVIRDNVPEIMYQERVKTS